MKEAALHCILRLFAGCPHERESWPIRLPGEALAHRSCLDCGRRRPYTLLDPRHHLPVKPLSPPLDYLQAPPRSPRCGAAQRLKKGEFLAA